MRIPGTPAALGRAMNDARHAMQEQARVNGDVRYGIQRYIDTSVRNGQSRLFAVLSAARFAASFPGDPTFGVATLKAIGVHPDDAERLPPRVREIFHGALIAAVQCTANHYIGRAAARDYLNEEVARIISDESLTDADRLAALEAYRHVIGDTYGDYATQEARAAITWER